MAFKSIFTIIFFQLSILVFSQNIDRDTYFSTAGNYKNTGSLKLQYNIGELMGDTYTGSQNILTQGFVQPEPPLTVSINNVINAGNCILFPNPVSGNLHILLELTDYSDVTIQLFDVIGKLQPAEATEINSNGKYTSELNFSRLRSGIYFVRIVSVKNQFNKTFKVSKI